MLWSPRREDTPGPLSALYVGTLQLLPWLSQSTVLPDGGGVVLAGRIPPLPQWEQPLGSGSYLWAQGGGLWRGYQVNSRPTRATE